MLKSFFCVFLFFVAVCNSFAGDKACKEVIKNFWDGYTFVKPETIRYISMDFYAKDNQIFSRKSFENYVKDFNSYKDLVRKKQYAEAMTLFKKLLDQSSVKVVKRDTRTWAQLSEKERQASISFMKSSLKTNKYMVKQNQTMQIKDFAIKGNNAFAVITFKNPLDQTTTRKITLVKTKGKWLVEKIEGN